jgi:hypothetical protein
MEFYFEILDLNFKITRTLAFHDKMIYIPTYIN